MTSSAPDDALPNLVVIYNARNFRLTEQQVTRASRPLRAEVLTAEAQPERTTAIAMGDFNFADEAPMEMQTPLINEGLPRLCRHNPEHQLAWEPVLQEMTEIDPE
eukprot:9485775-Pyramimonas_sp.AAC.1